MWKVNILSAGIIIHAFFDEQDTRRYGGFIVTVFPFTFVCFLIGSLAISGFPFLTGFYSKELIIEFSYKRYLIDGNFSYFCCIISALFTCIYSFRLLYYTFLT